MNANDNNPIEVGEEVEITVTVCLRAYSSAIALMIGYRFFYAYKNNRLSTAWCLAGGKLFSTGHMEELEKAEKAIAEKGKKSRRVYVTII